MKNLLLASTAIVAFAGAAAADGHIGVTFTGSATLGYNDTDQSVAGGTFVAPLFGGTNGNGVADDENGFYSDLDVSLGFAAELDNGLTAAASIDLEDFIGGGNNESSTGDATDFELSLTSETSGLFYGDTNFAAQNLWISAGDMENDDFSIADGEEALRAEMTYANIETQLSYVLANNAGTRVGTVRPDGDDLDQLSVAMATDVGNFNIVAAYQAKSQVPAGAYSANSNSPAPTAGFGDNGDFTDAETMGLSVGTSFSGADVRFAVASEGGKESTGVQVAYPFGPVTASAYYVFEASADDNFGFTVAYQNGPIGVTFDYDDDQGTEKVGLEGSYDVGNGLTMFAGYLTEDGIEDAYYVAGTYDLGSGAELLVSYADADSEDDNDDDVGAGDYQVGTTVELTFDF